MCTLLNNGVQYNKTDSERRTNLIFQRQKRTVSQEPLNKNTKSKIWQLTQIDFQSLCDNTVVKHIRMTSLFTPNPNFSNELLFIIKPEKVNKQIIGWKGNYSYLTQLKLPLETNELTTIDVPLKYNINNTLLSGKIYGLIYNSENNYFLNELYNNLQIINLFNVKANKTLSLSQLNKYIECETFKNNLIIIKFLWNNNLKLLNKYDNEKYNANNKYYKYLEEIPNKILYFINRPKKTSGIIILDWDFIKLTQLDRIPAPLFQFLSFSSHYITFFMFKNPR